jgi:hypothetical protein
VTRILHSVRVSGAKGSGRRRWVDAVLHPTPGEPRSGFCIVFAALGRAAWHWRSRLLPWLAPVWLTIAGLLKARRSAEVSDLAHARVADQLAIAVGAQWEAEACIHHLNDPCLLPVSWAAADVSLADPWDQLEMLPDTGVAQLASPSPGTWATSPDDLASPPSDTWGFKSLGIQAPGFRECLRARQRLRASLSRPSRQVR